VAQNFPEECRYVLETLRGVYHNDALAREQNLSADARLHFHQEHSRPLLTNLHAWMEIYKRAGCRYAVAAFKLIFPEAPVAARRNNT
jgi:hypothetical protein